jgi:hypothetical protein
VQDQGDKIATALDRLHAGGWSVGDPAFYVAGGGLVHVVIGSNGENQIRAEGATCREAWHRALDQAAAVGMLPGRPRRWCGPRARNNETPRRSPPVY